MGVSDGGVGPVSIDQVIACEDIAVRGKTKGETVNGTIGQRSDPTTVVELQVANDTISQRCLLKLAQRIVMVYGEQRAGMVRINKLLRNMQIECQNYAHEHGVDPPEMDQWTWPG
jgi:phosphoketolase